MSAADQILRIAKTELGEHEYPFNSNKVKYAEWYGMNGQPWCAMFVSWVFAKAGQLDAVFGKHASCAQWAESARLRDALVTHGPSTQPGDLVLYKFGARVPGHVGIVEHVHSDGSVTAIEGNTSGRSNGSQANGGEVCRKHRSARLIWAVITPHWLEVQRSGFTLERMLKHGDRGPDVTMLQQELGIHADGIFGPRTLRAVRQFQDDNDLLADGIVGPITADAIGWNFDG